MTAPTATRWIYDFDEGSREMRDLLGGKGANVAEMTRLLGAERVPAGFTITTEACVAYMRGGRVAPEGLDAAIDEALARLEHEAGRRLGDPGDPLLVSVRSGARDSMPGMMDTVLNLGLNDDSVAGPGARDGQRALRLGLLPPPRPDVRERRARHPRRALRGRDRAPEGRARRPARHRARHGCAARADPPLPGALPLPARAARPAARGRAGRVRLLDGRPRGRLPADQRDPGGVGHRGQRAADGLRQPRPDVRLGRRLLPRRGHRRTRAERRLPRRRAGRGRGLGRAHAARPRRAGGVDARRARRADGDPPDARAPLQGHPGHRVHHRAGAAVHAADALRQAAGPGGRPLRRRRGRRRGCSRRPRRSPRSTPARWTPCCTRPSTPPRATTSSPAASPPRRARPRAPSSSRPRRPSPPPRRATPSCWSGPSPRPTTSPASTPRRAS